MKKISLALIIIIAGICIPAVSAVIISDETYSEIVDKTVKSSPTNHYDSSHVIQICGIGITPSMASPAFKMVTTCTPVTYITNYGTLPNSANAKFDIYRSNRYGSNVQYYGTGEYGYFKTRINGQNRLNLWMSFDDDCDYSIISGNTFLKFVNPDRDFIYPTLRNDYAATPSDTPPLGAFATDTSGYIAVFAGHYTYSSSSYTCVMQTAPTYSYIIDDWSNRIVVDEIPGIVNRTDVTLYRNSHSSDFYLSYKNGGSQSIAKTADVTYTVDETLYPISYALKSVQGTWYNKTFFTDSGGEDPGTDPGDPGTDPGDASVNVYIKNSQTGALIANANVAIDALVNGTYYPVVNRTEPSGIFSRNLQPTGGGHPNPDGYRLIVTADGYNNPMPEINFTVDDYKKYIYCLLDPIAGGPANENKTFIDFFVRDMSSYPISGATVKFGQYTLITNSAGYTVFEVDKSNTYSWTVSKSGYGPLTGNAVIGDAPRHTINTVLAPAVTPTPQTPIPTGTAIGPKPTMTAPSGEPVSNWLEWFAAHFGMILGGGVEIGKIFMWLCFTIPVGVYVGKESKAGAAGFMAGAGIVTLFFVLIGWVPIWLLVLLALIIGLLYAKVLNNSDTGGGR